MKAEPLSRIQGLLQAVADGQLEVVRHTGTAGACALSPHRFFARTSGRGKIESYALFPGLEASYHLLLAPKLAVCHQPSDSVLEVFHCRSGRVGWNMQGGTAVYLGAGDLTAHSTSCCAASDMVFPLGWAEGISFSMDLEALASGCSGFVEEARLNLEQLRQTFCAGQPVMIPACPETEHIFAPLYAAPEELRYPYLKLKAQELLLYLHGLPRAGGRPVAYSTRQTEQIREIHRLLTEHLDRRFTIEELSKRFLINTSTLKQVFKAVYGLPIASYMKEYRVRQAMKLLRETDASIAEIAVRVGYETQGKFSKAFQDVAQVLPSQYRRECQSAHCP